MAYFCISYIIDIMASRWVQCVKEWSAKNNESYMCAATKPEVREAYRAKYGVSKRKPQYKEEQDMGAEDIDAKDVSRVVKRKTVKKTVAQSKEVLSEDEERRRRIGETMERFYMGKEDFNVKPPVAELASPPVVSTLETPRISGRNPAKMVFDMPELNNLIESFNVPKKPKKQGDKLLPPFEDFSLGEEVLVDEVPGFSAGLKLLGKIVKQTDTGISVKLDDYDRSGPNYRGITEYNFKRTFRGKVIRVLNRQIKRYLKRMEKLPPRFDYTSYSSFDFNA
jgi:hypothetical protein